VIKEVVFFASNNCMKEIILTISYWLLKLLYICCAYFITLKSGARGDRQFTVLFCFLEAFYGTSIEMSANIRQVHAQALKRQGTGNWLQTNVSLVWIVTLPGSMWLS